MEPIPTWQPQNQRPPITFVDAIALGFKNFTNFRGVARRSEYWYWTLFTVLLGMVTGTLDTGVATAIPNFTAINDVASIVLLLPTLTVTVRRFRDAGFSPWLLLLQLVPVLLLIALAISAVASAVPFFSQYTEDELTAMTNELVEKGTGPLATAIQGGLFNGVLGFALIVLVVSLAIGIWQLVILCRPTKSFEQGNKYVAPTAPTQPLTQQPNNWDDGGTTS
ncbi:MAG: hypothetical protein RIS80_1101 [Actinomycetota bacterium]